MKSSEFIVEAVNKRSYNKQIVDALKVHGFKVTEREQSAGALKTWLKVDNTMTLQDIVAELAPKFPGTKVEDWDGDMESEIRGPGFQIEKQGRGSIFLAVYAGPKADEYAMGLDEDDGMDAVRAGDQVRAKRQARLKAEIEAGMMPTVQNVSSTSDANAYTMGDVEALGWMTKDYHSYRTGSDEDDYDTTWTRYYHREAPGAIRVGSQIWQPGFQEEE